MRAHKQKKSVWTDRGRSGGGAGGAAVFCERANGVFFLTATSWAPPVGSLDGKRVQAMPNSPLNVNSMFTLLNIPGSSFCSV